MGQVALGLKNLAVRLVVFVVMAALLAWALGGTLFPGSQRVNLEPWQFDGAAWNWRVTGSSTSAAPTAWTLVELRDDRRQEQRYGIEGTWRQVWGPRLDGAGMTLGVAAEDANGEMRWWRFEVAPSPRRHVDLKAFDSRSEFLDAMRADAVAGIP